MAKWISLIEAESLFSNAKEFKKFVEDHEIQMRGKYWSDYTVDTDNVRRTTIPHEFLLNSSFDMNFGTIYANDGYGVPEGYTNCGVYRDVQVSKESLEKAISENRKAKRGPRFKYRQRIFEIFDEEYDEAMYSDRQFAEYVRSIFKLEGGAVPDERTVRRNMEIRLKAIKKSNGHNSAV